MNLPSDVVVFDLETTGLSPQTEGIVEIGAVRIEGEVITDDIFESLVLPTDASGLPMPIPAVATGVHGITDAHVENAPTIAEVLPRFIEWADGLPLVAHNLKFDNSFMLENARRQGLEWPSNGLCTMQLSRQAFPKERSHKLDLVAERFDLQFVEGGRHRSMGDVIVTAHAYLRLRRMLARD